MEFKILARDGKARRGELHFARGIVRTPAFMPVGTLGTVKGIRPEQVSELGADILLGNTFHLWLRPGTEVIKAHGDLHDFMRWDKPILTDSGGFQVFSLAGLRKVTEEGVKFQHPINGSKLFLSPEVSMQVQYDLGSDIGCNLMSALSCLLIISVCERLWSCLYAGLVVVKMSLSAWAIKMPCLALFKVVLIRVYVRPH